MRGLIPRDYWEHHAADVGKGFAAAIVRKDGMRMVPLPGIGPGIPIITGRAGLVAALQALGLPRGARVGVPLYCCPVVFGALAAADCAPRFLDIDPETFCLSAEDLARKSADLDAVVAVHLFGNTCDLRGLAEAAPGKPIIEDCAQSLGSRIEDRPVGTSGAMSIFSFRSSKYLSAGEGGAVFSNDPELRSRLDRIVRALPRASRFEEIGHLAKVYLKSVLRGRPLYGWIGRRLWAFVNRETDATARPKMGLSRIRRADLAVAESRFAGLDQAVLRQRAHAEFFLKTLDLDPRMLCFERPGRFYNRFHFPLTFPSTEQRDAVAAFLLRRGIDSNKYLDGVVDVAAGHYGYAGDCPETERISRRVLTIPVYHALRDVEVRRIAEAVNQGWSRAAGRSGKRGR
jgi:perosamine synthetase